MAGVRRCIWFVGAVVLGLGMFTPTAVLAATWTGTASLPTARAGAAAASVAGQPYVFGGWDGSDRVNTGEFLGGDSSWHPTSPFPGAGRQDIGAVSVGGQIYLVGGNTFSAQTATWVDFASILRYNPASDRWRTLAPLPRGVSDAAVVAHKGFVYVFGGNTSGDLFNNAIRSTYRYNITTNRWKTLAPMPTPRMGARAVVVGTSQAYVIGGYNSAAGYVGTNEVYNFTTNHWSPRAPLANGRYEAVIRRGGNGDIYAVGGFGFGAPSTNDVSREVDRYNPATNTWIRLPDAPTPRYASASAAINGKIFVIGGDDPSSTATATVDVFSP
jgi:N-acetylneuraminic acid mutarotase